MFEDDSVICLRDFQAHTQNIEKACRDWWEGRLEDDTFLEKYRSSFSKLHAILEISLQDDDFDWATIPLDIRQACDAAWTDHQNIRRLLEAVRATILRLKSTPMLGEDSICRMIIFGECLREFRFDYQLLSSFTNQSTHVQAPQPQPQMP